MSVRHIKEFCEQKKADPGLCFCKIFSLGETNEEETPIETS